MLRLLQIYKLLNTEQRKLFIQIFDDISYEIDELGYSPVEACDDMLQNHFGIEFESETQLRMFSIAVMKNQGKLKKKAETLDILFETSKEVA